MDGSPSKTPSPTILVTQNENDITKGSFVSVPRFWIDDYFNSHCIWTGSNNKVPRVPASFWKFTFHLWRWVSIPPGFGTKIAMDSFPVRADAAVMWTAAYAVSGVMQVQAGRWTQNHDEPTEFTYQPNTPHSAWHAYLNALDIAHAKMIAGKKAKRSEHDLKIGANVGAWKVIVALQVDEYREQRALPPVNRQFLEEAADGRILDNYGRAIAQRKDGTIQPCFYVRKLIQKPDETEDDFERRLCHEIDKDQVRGF